MPDTGGDPGLARTIRFLRWLTGLLAATMILGLITIVTLLVTRWPVPAGGQPAPALPAPALPATLRLPEGVTAEAVTIGPGWALVVTGGGTGDRPGDEEVVVFDPATGQVINRMPLRP
jgi:hypothetical protein